jgi:hypothetical protein
MIPIGTLGFLQFFLLYICPLLGVISCIILIVLVLNFLSQKLTKKASLKNYLSFKVKIFLVIFIILNVWNIYLFIISEEVGNQVSLAMESKEKRKRFILPVDYVYDGFVFPQGTLINVYNVHDDGSRYRYLTLSGLEQARFQQPVQIAGVWANAIKIDSDFNFLIEISQDQDIAPVYIPNDQGEYQIDSSHALIHCKKDQIAQYTVNSDYYPDKDYTLEDWYTLEEERFNPKQWLFRGCFSAPPIYVERPYPQTKLHDEERMSEVTNAAIF